ncbi:MAG: D-glycerate dehydrogenase [Anaerolineae bacterium]|nr:D-glycerate dehydrogenase [Anaerolineae bacterium]
MTGNLGIKVFVTRRIVGLEDYIAQYNLSHARIDVWEGTMPPPYEELVLRSRDCDGVLTMLTDKIDAAYMDSVPKLKVISQCAVGVNNIDLKAATELGIPVGNTPGVLTEATADIAFALLLSAARHIVPGYEYVKSGNWQTWDPLLLLGQQVWGATLGVIGYGRIGKAMALRGKGFNMRILASSRTLTAEDAAKDGAELASMETILREADFVSLHTPLTKQTHHLIGARELALMKPTATLINTARGEIVDPGALFAALKQGRPGFAALDVTEPEPLPPDHPLLTLPNCVIVPHLGSATIQTRREMTRLAVANLAAGLRGAPLMHRAN